jgi:tellurite resistance protein TehA-like permease
MIASAFNELTPEQLNQIAVAIMGFGLTSFITLGLRAEASLLEIISAFIFALVSFIIAIYIYRRAARLIRREKMKNVVSLKS